MVQRFFCVARENLVLVFILITSLVGRVLVAPLLKGISGGDFFNFLLITEELVKFHTPFIAKRLPFYPLLLIPGHLLGHPIGWAKILGVSAGLGILVVLYLLGRQLKIKKEILYLALIFTSFQPTLFIYSLRPLTHTLFTLEVLFSLYLFYTIFYSTRGRGSIKKLLLFGVVLGITSMTRHEGFILAAVVILCWLIARVYVILGPTEISNLKTLTTEAAAIGTPFILIVAPYFISNYLSFGNPVYSGYVEDPGLNRVTDLQSFLVNFEKVKWIILNLWGQTGYFPIKWVLIPSVLMLLAAILLKRFRLICVIGLLSYWVILHLRGPFDGLLALLSFFFACAMILGGLKFIIDTRWRGVPLLLILITQTILLMFIQPWARHLQHTFPFWALFLALGLSWVFEKGGTRCRGYINSAVVVVLSGFVLFNCYTGIEAGVASHQRGVLPTQPLFDAVEFVKNFEGPIAFESNASWVQYYIGDEAVYFAKDLEIPPVDDSYQKPVDEQWRWVWENNPKYLVHYNLWDGFSLTETKEFGDRFQLVKSFESVRDGERFVTKVYRVRLPLS